MLLLYTGHLSRCVGPATAQSARGVPIQSSFLMLSHSPSVLRLTGHCPSVSLSRKTHPTGRLRALCETAPPTDGLGKNEEECTFYLFPRAKGRVLWGTYMPSLVSTLSPVTLLAHSQLRQGTDSLICMLFQLHPQLHFRTVAAMKVSGANSSPQLLEDLNTQFIITSRVLRGDTNRGG
jgi:hypothetical protein